MGTQRGGGNTNLYRSVMMSGTSSVKGCWSVAHGNNTEQYHKIVGTWTPDIPEGDYEMVVHLPSHGANSNGAEFVCGDIVWVG